MSLVDTMGKGESESFGHIPVMYVLTIRSLLRPKLRRKSVQRSFKLTKHRSCGQKAVSCDHQRRIHQRWVPLQCVNLLLSIAYILHSIVKNHGISEEVITRALTATQEFFSLPDEKKLEVDNKKTANFKGYNAVLASNNDPNGAGDMHEGFEFGWEELSETAGNDHRASDGVMAGGNIWPSSLPGFREAVLTY
jgi:hypothetical protein